MQKIRLVVQYQEQMNDAEVAALPEVVARAGLPVDVVAPGWQVTGEAPPTIRATYDISGALNPQHGIHPPADGWLRAALEGVLAAYEALPANSAQRKLGRQVGFGWAGGSNRLDGAPHDVCAEIRALLAG